MNFDEYQAESRKTAIYKAEVNIVYPALGLSAEAGEVSNKIKKLMLKQGVKIKLSKRRRSKLMDECGDVLWYLANFLTDIDASLNDVALNNLEKLKSRQGRGKLVGSGDNR